MEPSSSKHCPTVPTPVVALAQSSSGKNATLILSVGDSARRHGSPSDCTNPRVETSIPIVWATQSHQKHAVAGRETPTGAATSKRAPAAVDEVLLKMEGGTKMASFLTPRGITAGSAPGSSSSHHATTVVANIRPNTVTLIPSAALMTDQGRLLLVPPDLHHVLQQSHAGVELQVPGTPVRVTTTSVVTTPRPPQSSPMGSSFVTLCKKRTRDSLDSFDAPDGRCSKRTPRCSDKSGKGLRHFSLKVLEKVQSKGTTTYNEVADELVQEFSGRERGTPGEQPFDQKNIRRRVYDALNVLMAMRIIIKEKKEIRWVGHPANSAHELERLEKEVRNANLRIKAKAKEFEQLLVQQIALKNLVERNKSSDLVSSPGNNTHKTSYLKLPFIIISTSKQTNIDCRISHLRDQYAFVFDRPFTIHDDMEVLKRMGLAFNLGSQPADQQTLDAACRLVPPDFVHFVQALGSGTSENFEEYLREHCSKASRNTELTATTQPFLGDLPTPTSSGRRTLVPSSRNNVTPKSHRSIGGGGTVSDDEADDDTDDDDDIDDRFSATDSDSN